MNDWALLSQVVDTLEPKYGMMNNFSRMLKRRKQVQADVRWVDHGTPSPSVRLGVALDWDGCGYVLLNMLNEDVIHRLQHEPADDPALKQWFPYFAPGPDAPTACRTFRDRCHESGNQLIDKIHEFVLQEAAKGDDALTLHLFVGSNRQSVQYDDENTFQKRTFKLRALKCFPYVAEMLASALTRRLHPRQVNVDFQSGLLSDHWRAPTCNSREDFETIQEESYGTAIADPL